MRKLADRSQEAAREISELSNSTLTRSEEAGEMSSQLVPDIRRTADPVAEISAACREQSVGIEQLNQAITQFDQVTQSEASAADEMAATAEQLSAEAADLGDHVSFFKPGEETASACENPDMLDAETSRMPPGEIRAQRASSLNRLAA